MKKNFLHKYDIQITVAIVMLLFGMAMTVWGFIVDPKGMVSDSVLDVFSRCLIFSGSALGIGAYINARFNDIDKLLNQQNNRKEEHA